MQVVFPSVTIHIPGLGLGGLGFAVVVDVSVVEDTDVVKGVSVVEETDVVIVVSVVVSEVVDGVIDVEC